MRHALPSTQTPSHSIHTPSISLIFNRWRVVQTIQSHLEAIGVDQFGSKRITTHKNRTSINSFQQNRTIFKNAWMTFGHSQNTQRLPKHFEREKARAFSDWPIDCYWNSLKALSKSFQVDFSANSSCVLSDEISNRIAQFQHNQFSCRAKSDILKDENWWGIAKNIVNIFMEREKNVNRKAMRIVFFYCISHWMDEWMIGKWAALLRNSNSYDTPSQLTEIIYFLNWHNKQFEGSTNSYDKHTIP